jgi:hypothetical protein
MFEIQHGTCVQVEHTDKPRSHSILKLVKADDGLQTKADDGLQTTADDGLQTKADDGLQTDEGTVTVHAFGNEPVN